MSYVPTEAKTAIVGAKVSEVEKAAWEEAVQRLGLESVSDLIRVAVRSYLDRPAPRALEKAEALGRDVEARYKPLLERVETEIVDAKNKLSAVEGEASRLASEIEELSRPPGLEEGPESIAAKINELAQKRVLLDATNLKVSQLREYVQSLEEKRRKIEARKEREKVLALRGLVPEVFKAVLDHLVAEVSEAGLALRPYLHSLADRERPQMVLRWLAIYLGWQARKMCPEAWDLVGRPHPLVPSQYETWQAFLQFLDRFCGPIGPAARGDADADTVSVAER